jgi:hypothetical protein
MICGILDNPIETPAIDVRYVKIDITSKINFNKKSHHF